MAEPEEGFQESTIDELIVRFWNEKFGDIREPTVSEITLLESFALWLHNVQATPVGG